MKIDAKTVMQLRKKTGAGIMDAKTALKESEGNEEKAIEWLRKKGLASSEKRSGKATSEGSITSYIHMGGKIGVLIEINCETDFVARTEDFVNFTTDMAMQVAAANPQYVNREEIPEAVVAKEKEILTAQAKESGKPEQVIEKMVSGRIEKFYSECCLIDQTFIKDSDKSINDLLVELRARTGENIVIKRFTRYQMGE